ncbi:TonB-dependent receptor [candidate division KSB1 bacterium]|nr:TonB-dependent receptor [candidate division KSB1 bacterium]
MIRPYCNIQMIIMTLVVLVINSDIIAQENIDYYFNDIVVTATRAPLSFPETGRAVTVIKAADLATIPCSSLGDVLDQVTGIDIQQRGAYGVQSDVRMRGSTFEQTLILIDGVKVTDPQTGHHLLDLPVSLNDIDRIEVLKGPASRLYGPNAFGGVINVITKINANSRINAELSGGQHSLFGGNVNLSAPLGSVQNFVSVSREKSEGFRPGADFNIDNLFIKSSYTTPSLQASIAAGYTDKQFGAYKFYSDAYPDEWEQTTTRYANATLNTHRGAFNFSLKTYWRQHDDDFILDRFRPDWYRNMHTTYISGIEGQLQYVSQLGVTSTGFDIGNESIESSSLGDHSRQRRGVFVEQLMSPVQFLNIVAGMSVYRTFSKKTELNPGLDISLQLPASIYWFASASRSYREPSYTELYYVSPANLGNPNLNTEHAWTFETGIKRSKRWYEGYFSIFHSRADQLIDWVRESPADPWQVQNWGKINTNGLEAEITVFPSQLIKQSLVSRIKLGYTFLNKNQLSHNLESKSVFNYLRHQTTLTIQHGLVFNINYGWTIRYDDRVGVQPHGIVDVRMSRKIGNVELWASISNLLNVTYNELGYVPAPGRWGKLGVQLRY